jgi:hypothetical protein
MWAEWQLQLGSLKLTGTEVQGTKCVSESVHSYRHCAHSLPRLKALLDWNPRGQDTMDSCVGCALLKVPG